ncbi:MAG: hypothetical protein U9Q82_00510 [Chloroflexota bacterium]|nr:hypothetical protein [Chloroflexota bacterium]
MPFPYTPESPEIASSHFFISSTGFIICGSLATLVSMSDEAVSDSLAPEGYSSSIATAYAFAFRGFA